jgi:hypothetical protein
MKRKSKHKTRTKKGNVHVLKGGRESCHFFDKQYKGLSNEIWKTCVTVEEREYHIIHITPKNVLIKSIETMQHPLFIVKIGNFGARSYKIRIEDKYIACFLRIGTQWYVIMRLFGTTLNTGFFCIYRLTQCILSC